ncbi:TatD family hydrolase [Opitutae bacterium]|nr:TatD family hydrolase [Opitutae bacterium]
MEWIDSHCHLDGFLNKGILPDVLDRASASGVNQMIAIGTDLKDWEINYNLAAELNDRIAYTVGLHPCYVTEAWVKAVEQLEEYFSRPILPVALGEIGLDYFHLPIDIKKNNASKVYQQSAFEVQLQIAKRQNCPIVIHSRNAFEDTISMIEASDVDWKKVVVHCFSYSAEQIKLLVNRGGRASFTGIITYKNAPNIQKALIEQGVDKLMIETDSPYLSPEPYRGKKNEPGYVADIGLKCAELFGIKPEALAKKLAENTRSFFGLKCSD